jgi:hypothetical protein
MTKRNIGKTVLFCAGLVLAASGTARPQYKADEIAQRETWENFLLTAEILKSEPIGEGVTIPWKIYLKKGDIEKKAAWKGTTEPQNWKFEIAAYRLDKLLSLAMLPPAVEREFQGRKGALILWADSKINLLKLMDKNAEAKKAGKPEEPSKEFEEIVNRGKYITRIWDCLIANEDRTQENILYTEDWRTILIDHSFAFRSEGEFAERLVFGRNGIKKYESGDPILIKMAPRWLVAKIQALDFESIRQAVGPYLTRSEINAVLSRKKILLDEIAAMAKIIGEAKFYFD